MSYASRAAIENKLTFYRLCAQYQIVKELTPVYQERLIKFADIIEYPWNKYPYSWYSGGNCMIISLKVLDQDGWPVYIHFSDEMAGMYTFKAATYEEADKALSYLDIDDTLPIVSELLYLYDEKD